ncbi:nuclear transport factor 2 family protein [Ekhidna sp.]
MKTLTTLIGLLVALSVQSQKTKNMEQEKNAIEKVVTQVFVSTDNQKWTSVEDAFNDQVLLDYTSMAGGEPAHLSPSQITDSWKTILPGFDHTHHALSNFNIEINGTEATVSHYGNADHFIDLKNDKDVWTVVGTYDHHLLKTPSGWKIDQMKFNLKYMDGNMDLPRIAQERVKGVKVEDLSVGDKNKQTVAQFFALLEKEDIPSFISLFAEDGRQVNPYSSGLFPKGASGKEELTAYWTPVPENFDGMQFPIEEIYAMEDPSIVFVKYTGKIKLKNNAGWYENDYYSTFKFNNEGKIMEYVEIFNPIVAARGFGMIDQIK